MKIKKYGHCALLIEENGIRILTDPGNYSLSQTEALNLNAVFITHEHSDHLHLDSLKTLIQKNPGVRVISNSGTGKILAREGISFELMEDGAEGDISGLKVSAMGNKHAEIYGDFGQVQNTGFFFGERFFYPGDALYVPSLKPEILAMPVAGSWLKISEAMKYVLEIGPKTVLPVHDGILKNIGLAHKVPSECLPAAGINFVALGDGTEADFDPA